MEDGYELLLKVEKYSKSSIGPKFYDSSLCKDGLYGKAIGNVTKFKILENNDDQYDQWHNISVFPPRIIQVIDDDLSSFKTIPIKVNASYSSCFGYECYFYLPY